jgi:hypothetical protein
MGNYPKNRKPRKYPPLIERFMAKAIEDVSGCWLWTARRDALGYGWMRTPEGVIPAHRASWILFKGKIPPHNGAKFRSLILHRCDNSSCVNPDHLFLGTDADNCADRDKKGRQAKGAKNGSARFSENDVINIRSLRKNGLTLSEISKRMNAPEGTIANICSGATWSWLR